MGVSRGSVQQVLRDGRAEVPPLERAEKAEPYRAEILDQHARCKGNLVRVHEELVAAGAALSYQALTAFCRRHRIGYEPPRPAGRYHFAPGQEMQHDTSPHEAPVGGRKRSVQTASLVLCHSRMIFMQMYPRFTRFECKVFLTDALTYFDGACEQCMIDNTHVVVASGSGPNMVPAPEMAAFAERFDFAWRAHIIGDANRSARVERPFDYIDNNFLAGRSFEDFADLNRQAIAWCDKVNAAPKRHLHAAPRELFAAEQPTMRRLPAYVPEVYALHQRVVDTEGYVNVHRNRYSAPWQLIGRQVEVRETKVTIEIFDGPRRVALHDRVIEPLDARITVAAHRPPRHEGVFARAVSDEAKRLVERMPETIEYIALLKKRGRGSGSNAWCCGASSATSLRVPRTSRPSPRTTMMTDESAQLLKALRLGRIAQILDDELKTADKDDLGYQELIVKLLRAQWHHQQESALTWRIERAKLPEKWSLKSFPFKRQPGVSQKQIRGFAQLDFVPKAENIVFIGPTGVGKTGIASGLLLKALQNGYRGLFLRAQDLFDEMYASLADRSSRKLLNRLARVDVLVIDEMGYLNLRPEQTNIFFKLMEERYRRRATIITTNLQYDEWHNFLGNKALVDALLSRLRHQCHTVKIDGPSLRDPQG